MKKDNISIRRYRQADHQSEDFYSLAETAFTYGSPWSKEQYEQTISRSDLVFFIAEYDHELIGYIGGKLLVDEVEIYSIAVAAPFQNKKVASKLITAFKTYCTMNEMSTIFLEVRESNETARYFYQSHAFSEIARRKRYYTYPIEDAIIMKCSLGKKEEDDEQANFSD
ncbi:MAG: ribosomal protein S18-alanine N-acetyltransferase [Alkalibacterium sp.]|nr:ribosomal protein S18-alanine N-acetyltransferase [Alkalibacterium sp.]